MGYPVTNSDLLNNTVYADSTVSLVSGMQVAVITFKTSAASFGGLTLSARDKSASDLHFLSGSQEIKMAYAELTPAFGLQGGHIRVTGTVTDENGKNPSSFDQYISNWS